MSFAIFTVSGACFHCLWFWVCGVFWWLFIVCLSVSLLPDICGAESNNYISMNEVVLVHHVSMLLLVMLQLLVNSLVAEKQKALIFCKHCPAIAKTLMCYQCCFSRKSKTVCAAVKKVNPIPTKPSNPLVLCCEGWSSCSFRNPEIFFPYWADIDVAGKVVKIVAIACNCSTSTCFYFCFCLWNIK